MMSEYVRGPKVGKESWDNVGLRLPPRWTFGPLYLGRPTWVDFTKNFRPSGMRQFSHWAGCRNQEEEGG